MYLFANSLTVDIIVC